MRIPDPAQKSDVFRDAGDQAIYEPFQIVTLRTRKTGNILYTMDRYFLQSHSLQRSAQWLSDVSFRRIDVACDLFSVTNSGQCDLNQDIFTHPVRIRTGSVAGAAEPRPATANPTGTNLSSYSDNHQDSLNFLRCHHRNFHPRLKLRRRFPKRHRHPY